MIQNKKAHLLQGLQILLRDRKNWGLHLQIASLFFEPVEEKKKRNYCHNMDREENKGEKIHSKMDKGLSFFQAWKTATEEEIKDLSTYKNRVGGQ